jgi:molybdenum transport protein
MSFYISDSEIERIIEEDISALDLTSTVMGIGNEKASITYKTRNETVIACSEEVVKILQKLGITVSFFRKSGEKLKTGETIIEGSGSAADIHIVWRTCSKLLEYYCGLATRTYTFVKEAQQINTTVNIACTRKNIPGTKKMTLKSIVCAGAFPHRVGLSETIMIFQEHIHFVGGQANFIRMLPQLKQTIKEKKIGAEAQHYNDGIQMVTAGLDIVQLDKFPAEEVKRFITEAKSINHAVTVVAAGNIRMDNVKEYAATGVDVLATSALYHGKPADIKVVIST